MNWRNFPFNQYSIYKISCRPSSPNACLSNRVNDKAADGLVTKGFRASIVMASTYCRLVVQGTIGNSHDKFRSKCIYVYLPRKLIWKCRLQKKSAISFSSQCVNHCSVVTWESNGIKWPTTPLFVQQLAKPNNKRNIKIPFQWPFVRNDFRHQGY